MIIEIIYVKCGDYLVPNLVANPEPKGKLRKFGYKEKLFRHPIHTEFTKSYNRPYARIRRRKLSADTPLMEQLKALHDEYTEKYENTHKKDREAVWKEYIEKNKELLRLNSAKSQQG